MANMKIKDNSVIISANPKIYPLEAIYSAAYVFLDRAYLFLDGDPKKEVSIEIRPKGREDPEKLGNEFSNELLNYTDYQKRAENSKKIREMIMQRAIITNDPSAVRENVEKPRDFPEPKEGDYLDDPEGIATPWEEKYGKENKE